MDKLPDALEQLTARVEALEQRIAVLESLDHTSSAKLSDPVAHLEFVPRTSEAVEELSLAQSGGLFSLLGKALLGIAGAYLLRAVAESSALPRLAIAAVAIVYALLWLVAAARAPVNAWLASTVYAGTSALILAPMLWELTLRFNVLPAPTTAGILCVFVVTATALAWKQNRDPISWMVNITAASSALALSIAAHDLAPFIAALLFMALLCEYAAVRSHPLGVRPLVAAALDLAVWALIFIYSGPESTRMEYPAIGVTGLLLPGIILFLVYAASVAVQTVLRGQEISFFEIGQTMIAFLLAASSLLYFEPHGGTIVLGAVSLLFSIACYAAVFVLFSKPAEGRNYHVFAAWAACLLVAGGAMSLPPFWFAACLSLAAIAATVSSDRLTLNFHGLVFLAAAAIASGLLKFALDVLAGTKPAALTASACLVTACAVVCYAAARRSPQENWRQQLLHLVPAALAAFALAALLIHGALSLIALRATPAAHHVAFIRTLILCVTALVLAYGGARSSRLELTRIAYATLGILAVKLLFEDLHLGNLEFIAAAIFFFAITLIAVPKLARMRKTSTEISQPPRKTAAI